MAYRLYAVKLEHGLKINASFKTFLHFIGVSIS